MIWVLFIVVALGVLGLFGALLSNRIGYDPLSEPASSQPDPGLPDNPSPADISTVRFDTALRGYRMDQVDDVLDRLQQRLGDSEHAVARQERELAELRAMVDGLQQGQAARDLEP